MSEEKLPDPNQILDEAFDEVRRAMRGLSEQLRDEQMKFAANPNGSAVRDASKLLTDVRAWTKLAIETEARFEERRKQRDGVAIGQLLDLDRARHEVGCRLARLRRCCDAQRVPK